MGRINPARVRNSRRSAENPDIIVRDFLNKPEYCHGAMMMVNIGDSDYSIKVKDCSKSATIHGEFYDEGSYENALHKVGTMIHILEQAKQGIVEKRALLPKAQKKRKKRRNFKKEVQKTHEEAVSATFQFTRSQYEGLRKILQDAPNFDNVMEEDKPFIELLEVLEKTMTAYYESPNIAKEEAI